MNHEADVETLRQREAPLDLDPEEFREIGHQLVDQIVAYLAQLKQGPVTPGESPPQVREAMHASQTLPELGCDAGPMLHETAELLFKHSLSNGHPRFFGYITSSAAPIGMLGDLLAAAVNPNCGAWKLAPMATEIEAQAVRWMAELLGYHGDCGGLMVSGGNMANFIGFLAARAAKIPWDLRKTGMGGAQKKPRVYASAETHTWIQKAADFFC
jgi:glutamate/tyrosine decarboxylase-like PLP-dependent enzyme